MRVAQRDNQYFALKCGLRDEAMRQAGINIPLICETNGGIGRIFQACYRHVPMGMVCETDEIKGSVLAEQRPSWRVYQCHAETTLAEGLGSDLPFTMLDCDPYGAPWDTLAAFFTSSRVFAPVMAIAVTDGSRQKQRLGGLMYGWESWQEQYGRNLWSIYLRCCQERFDGIVAQAGYARTWWHGRYSGNSGQMTYWGAVLRRDTGEHVVD